MLLQSIIKVNYAIIISFKLLLFNFRKNILGDRELVKQFDAKKIDDIAIQQMIQFLYSKKTPSIDTPTKFVNLMACALVFDLPELENYLLTEVPENLRIFKSDYVDDEKYQNYKINAGNYKELFKNSLCFYLWLYFLKLYNFFLFNS